jgi:small neutral amino acid transporter SnatA (MarC family)
MIVSRVFAVIIAAIAVEYIVEGIKNIFVFWILNPYHVFCYLQ